jgi:hypothetical protein
MTTPTTGIGAITLRAMRAKLEEAAAIVRAAEGLAADGQPGRGLMTALDVEPLAIEANSLLQGLAVLSGLRVTWWMNTEADTLGKSCCAQH